MVFFFRLHTTGDRKFDFGYLPDPSLYYCRQQSFMTHKFLQLAHKLIKLTFGVGGQNSSALKVVRAAKGIEIKIMTKNKYLFST